MSSSFRAVFDRLYIRPETALLAWGAVRANRRYAASVTPLSTLDKDYRDVVRPYWKQFRVRTPRKASFRLRANADKGMDGGIDPRYIPDDLWFHRIVPHYNNLIFAKALQDKNLHGVLFPQVRRPETVVRCVAGVFYDDGMGILTPAQAAARCHGVGRVIVKPTVGSGQGHNIRFYDTDEMTPAEAEAIFRSYGRNFIVQKKLTQHPALGALNPLSVNTVRVITMLREDGVHILSACLRVGGSKSEVDNSSQGGFAFRVGPDGTLTGRGCRWTDRQWLYTDVLPTGAPLAGYAIPGFRRIADTATELAARMGHFKIIGWDFAVAPDEEPVFIEFNVIPSQNQDFDGPTFGDMTDEILGEVFDRRG